MVTFPPTKAENTEQETEWTEDRQTYWSYCYEKTTWL